MNHQRTDESLRLLASSTGCLILAVSLISCSPKAPAPQAPVQPTAAAASPKAAVVPQPAATTAPAETTDPLEARYTPAYDKCMKTGDAADGVTSAMVDCTQAEISAQDAKLNATYKQVMGSIPADQQTKVKQAERDWVKLKDSKCTSENQTGGTMDELNKSGCVLEMTIKRTMELEDLAAKG